MRQPKDVLITDLASRVVGGFKPARGVGRGWVPVDFATAEFAGGGLAAGDDSGAPELALRLGLKGVHTLYLALAWGDGIRVWLDGEPGFREMVCKHGGGVLQECRLHTADLTGKRLHLAPVPAARYRDHDATTTLAYV